MTSFNGTKESCPNYINGRLDQRWGKYSESETKDAAFDSSSFQETCFEICGKDKYIENGECRSCPSNFYDPANPTNVNSEYVNAAFVEMCDHKSSDIENGIPIWFVRQREGNLSQRRIDSINWGTTDPVERNRIQGFWENDYGRVTDEYLGQLIGQRIPGQMDYVLPPEFTTNGRPDYDKLRRKINTGRGSIVKCDSSPEKKCYNVSTDTYSENTSGNYGPDQLVFEEVHDFWVNEYGGIPEESDMSSGAVQSFSELLSGLSLDSNFEACVNDKLNTGDNDYERQEIIKKYTKISEFTGQDMNYLKRKLKKIITIKSNELNECMSLLNLGESICVTGVADKTLQIGSLIFSIVGNNAIDVLNADNDDRMKLNKMIDELGPLIPQAVKNIIHVSKEYESRICNVPSNTTLLLERLYIDLYDKEVHVNLDISPYIDFNSLINMEPWKFGKTICVILVFSFLFMQFANIVVAFLSRGSTVTKIA